MTVPPTRSLWILIYALFCLCSGVQAESNLEFFEAKIRPLLAERCYQCHAQDTKQKAGLLLDSKAGWMTGGDTGPAIVPGNPDASLLFKAVTYESTDLQMPPKKKLSTSQIEDLRQWITMGASDPRKGDIAKKEEFDLQQRKEAHWVWHKPQAYEPPEVQRSDWPNNAIDHYILADLEKSGLDPNDKAEPHVLIRRLYFDLIGLPPTPEQVAAFEKDPSADAYRSLVKDLLRSSHYGERWGQHWLDIVRFAETWGHEADYPIPEAWRYRDYVIKAFNADVPYDDFLVEHVAGDLVETPRLDPKDRSNQSIQGTGFWHLGEATHSPVNIREDECLRVSNQIDVFSKAFMGMTVMCARCHDHKFDAISTKDYYALFGYLQSSSYHLADVSDPLAQQEAYEGLRRSRDAVETAAKEHLWRSYFLARAEDKLSLGHVQAVTDPGHPLFALSSVRKGDWAEKRNSVLALWDAMHARAEATKAARKVVRTERNGELNLNRVERPFNPVDDTILAFDQPDALWLAAGYRFGKEPVIAGSMILGDSADKPIDGLEKSSAAHSGYLSEKFTGKLRTKTFRVDSDRVWIRYRGEGRLFVSVDSHIVCQGPLHNARLKQHLKQSEDYKWVAHDMSKYIAHGAHLEFTPLANFSVSHVIASDTMPVETALPNAAVESLLRDPSVRSLQDFSEGFLLLLDKAVLTYTRKRLAPDDGLLAMVAWLVEESGIIDFSAASGVRDALAKYQSGRAALEAKIPNAIRALALMDGNGVDEPIHIRGNYRTLTKDDTRRGFLQALGNKAVPTEEQGSGRLALAQELVSPDNPLTSRVMVNRLWHHLFGRGLVETVDNFGSTGASPSNQPLLDHLALKFMEHDWSVKHLVEQMVLSSTYQMSSAPDPDKTAKDPGNELWHRMPIRRLPGEIIRDNILAVSGQLKRHSYGKSVMVHITDFMRNNRSPGGSGPLDGNGRRSIYVEGRRNHMEPLLVAFDKPTPFTAIGKRNVSNSPAQSLMLLNNEFVHEQAGLWAKRLLQDDDLADNGQRIHRAYSLAFARGPEPWEMEAALAFVEDQQQAHGGAPESVERAWADLAHTLFNVKSFIFIN